MNISIHANSTELTEALREYTEKKMEGLVKYFDGITRVAVDMGLISTHHQKGKIFFAEANVHLPQGKMIRVRKEADDLYKAIDKVKDHLKVELDEFKSKLRSKDREVLRSAKGYQE